MLEPVPRRAAARIAEASVLALVFGACTALTDLDYLGRGGEDAASSGSGAAVGAQGGEGGASTTAAGAAGIGGCDGLGCEGGAGGAGGAVGGTGGGGATGGTPDMGQCSVCGQQSCTSRGLDCLGDAACSDWLDCIGTCVDAACAYACDDMYSAGHQLYEDVYLCLCSSCLDECSFIDPCVHGN